MCVCVCVCVCVSVCKCVLQGESGVGVARTDLCLVLHNRHCCCIEDNGTGRSGVEGGRESEF